MQFANESLSMKLEDQLNDNEDLRNKYVHHGSFLYKHIYCIMLYYNLLYSLLCRSNATRNLCNILKDTFDRSAEKMNLCKCESIL